MSIDPILELIKERNAVEEKLSAVTKERDELHAMHNRNAETYNELLELCGKLRKERDEALEWSKAGKESAAIASAEIMKLRQELDDWTNAAAHVELDHPDEKHCGCVAILRKLLIDARNELHRVIEKWQSDKALLWAAVRIIHDKGLTVTSDDLIKVAKEIEETRHKLFLAEERLREEGILEYGN